MRWPARCTSSPGTNSATGIWNCRNPCCNPRTRTDAEKRGTRLTLIGTLEILLRALHPLAPFITEEIWQRAKAATGVTGETVMLAPFPVPADVPQDAAAETEMRWVRDFILGVRQIRGEMDIAPARRLEVLLQNAGPADLGYLGRNLFFLARLAGIGAPAVLAPGAAAPISAVALVGSLEILVPMAGLIDPAAEIERLARRLRKSEGELAKLEAKLAKPDFAANAPADIVAKDHARRAELAAEIGRLRAQSARVDALRAQ